jgi:hypothetical protein
MRGAVARQDDPALPRLNLLLAVAGAYFGQVRAAGSGAACDAAADKPRCSVHAWLAAD